MTAHRFETHEVTNQSPPFENLNLFTTDRPLCEAVQREGASWCIGELTDFGAKVGSAHAFDMGRLANKHPPELLRYDEKGKRIDHVEYHPAYHKAMAMSCAAGIHSRPWETGAAAARGGNQVARLAHLYLMTQVEPGHICPITMTHAVHPALGLAPDLYASLLPKLTSRDYDATPTPIGRKHSMTVGMAMTEKQGGTDVRANATTATPLGRSGTGEAYRLIGHKWFMSAPMSDAFLMLAQAPGGLSCFFVPRLRDDGTRNALNLERLKSKLGNRSNASSELELAGADAVLIGDEGRGVPVIIQMASLTRLDCAVASAGQMRLAVALAVHHCRHRRVFQKTLIDQPLMAAVLADMALDIEAATALAFRLARAFDKADDDAAEAAWARVMTPVTKYWNCKIAPALGYEAMECLGGNGYVEEGLAARLYRELPLNAIWEGSGNVMCLDVLRCFTREANKARLVLDELARLSAGDRHLEAALRDIESLLQDTALEERRARHLVELLARLAAGALLRNGAPAEVADAFIAQRLAAGFRHTYGAGPAIEKTGAILERAFPSA